MDACWPDEWMHWDKCWFSTNHCLGLWGAPKETLNLEASGQTPWAHSPTPYTYPNSHPHLSPPQPLTTHTSTPHPHPYTLHPQHTPLRLCLPQAHWPLSVSLAHLSPQTLSHSICDWDNTLVLILTFIAYWFSLPYLSHVHFYLLKAVEVIQWEKQECTDKDLY